MNRRRSDPVARAVRRCQRYWRGAGLPRERVADMRMELEQHLQQARAAGKSVESVVGEDPIAFADAWARESNPDLAVRRAGRAAGPAVVSLVAGVWAALAILVEPVRSTTSAWGSGVAVSTQSHLDTRDLVAVSLLAVVAALCLVAALMLFRGRRMLGCILLAIAFPIAFFVQVPAALLAAIALVWGLLAGRRETGRHGAPVIPSEV